MRACRARSSGTRCPTSTPGRSASTPCPSACGPSAIPRADIDFNAGRLDALHALADRDETEGLGDAPWPPHFAKQRGEPKRVQPSRDRDRPKPRQRGRAGDPQPGGPPDPQDRRPQEAGRRRAPRTGQGYEDDFEDA